MIEVKFYNSLEYDKKEILRYAKADKNDKATLQLIDECILESDNGFNYSVCYSVFDIKKEGESLNLGFTTTNSKDLQKNLENCHKIILFSATVGINIDRLILKYGKLAPSKALIFQAIGAERIESLANSFNEDIKSEFSSCYLTPRFSPGYGDLPLTMQKDIFNTLDLTRKIGITLNDSLLMTPTKSITAIIGISNKQQNNRHNCANCDLNSCDFRQK